MKRIVIKTSKILIYILLIITLLIATGIVAGYIYKDEIRNYVISEINHQIEVKVNVRSAEFSVLRKFPFVSIILSDATVLSGKNFAHYQFPGHSADTLLTASRIYLQFNIIDIFKKDYHLRRVHAAFGKINILVDKNGEVNYRIIKESSVHNINDFTLGLDGVKITGFNWEYRNLIKKIYSKGQIKDLTLKGNFSQNNFSLNTLSTLFIDSFNMEGLEYASGINLFSHLILNVKDTTYKISRGELTLNNLKFTAGGTFTNGTKTDLNLQLSGENLDINSLLSILPINKESIKKYSPNGKAEILMKIKGEFSNRIVPSIRAAFKVSNGKLFLPVRGNYINGIKLKGTFSNGSKHNATTSRIILNEYSLDYGNNHINGKLIMDNLIKPFLSASVTGTLAAKEISDILKIDRMNLEGGFIYPDINFNLFLDSIGSLKTQNISASGINGKLDFKGIFGKIPYSVLQLDYLDGIIKIDGGTWFPELNLKLGKNRFSVNLSISHLWEYLVDNSRIPEIKGELNSEYLSLPDFLPESDSASEILVHLPDSVCVNLHCKIDSFIYGKFLASDFETLFDYKPGLLSVSLLKMRTMKGKISAAGAIIAGNNGQMLLRTSGELRNIDIHNLFYSFNNFWQNFIVADNMNGSVTGKLDFSATINSNLKIQTKDLTAQSDFVIEEGELINFKPVTELSKFVELSELNHIKFSTLKNSILIKDEKVYFPQMDIKSSAFNLSISGTHGFDNYFEYKLRLNLSEILARKARNAKKENDEFGIIEEGESGNTNLYISISGTPENYKIRYDKKEAINKIKTDLKEEKKLLKSILREELGMFKKDSINIGNKSNNFDQKEFKMDWDDEKKPTEEPASNLKDKKIRKKDPAINITWEEEDPDLK